MIIVRRHRVGLAAALLSGLMTTSATGLAVALAVPAQAGGTAVAITVLPGPLTIGAPIRIGPLTPGPDHARQAALGRLQIQDGRAVGGVSWVVSITWSDFRSPVGPVVGATAVRYLPGEVTQVGSAHYTRRDLGGPGEPAGQTVTATDVLPGDLAAWDPSLRVFAPDSADLTTYTATITYSVL